MPTDEETWDELLLKTFGSPDPMQIDGIGGSHSTASKAMVLSESDRDGVDLEYRFGQVGIEKPVVDWGGNCGNLTFAIGPCALERGVITADTKDGYTTLVLMNANTETIVEQRVPMDGGSPRYSGDFKVHGVRGTGAPIRSRFLEPGGSVSGSTLPTGSPIDTLDVPGVGSVEVSMVDVSSPCVFARASDLGMTGAERPEDVNSDPKLLERLERVRSAACVEYGFVNDPAVAAERSPGIPKMAVVNEKRSYTTAGGETVDPDEYDLLARIMSMQKAHHAYAVTGAMCTAVAAVLEGTIPNEYLTKSSQEIAIGHPKGTMRVSVGVDGKDVTFTEVNRTARQIMHGDLYYER